MNDYDPRHTPGPWAVHWELDHHGRTVGVNIRPMHPIQGFSMGYKPLAKVQLDHRIRRRDRLEANAHLIAAAPHLLASSQAALAAIAEGDLQRAQAELTGAVHAALHIDPAQAAQIRSGQKFANDIPADGVGDAKSQPPVNK